MALDLNRIVQAAAEAVLEDRGEQRRQQSSSKRKGITAPRAMLLGAGLFTAGRLLVGSRGRNLVESFQDRLTELEDRYLSDDADEEEGEDEFYDDEELEPDEPEAQADEDEPADEFDDEEEPEAQADEDEPEGEFDDDEEPEGEFDDEEPEADYEEDGPEDEPEDEPERPRRTSSASGRRNGRH